jgi:hypothetical protein
VYIERWLFINYTPAGAISAQDLAIMADVNKFIPLHLAFYTGCVALGDQEAAIEPRHLATRIMMLAFKFAVVIFSGLYGANLANVFVAPPNVILKVPSLEVAIAAYAPVCVLTGDYPNVCVDCAPGSASPFSVVNSTYPGNVSMLPPFRHVFLFLSRVSCTDRCFTANARLQVVNFVPIRSRKASDLFVALNGGKCDAALMTQSQVCRTIFAPFSRLHL